MFAGFPGAHRAVGSSRRFVPRLRPLLCACAGARPLAGPVNGRAGEEAGERSTLPRTTEHCWEVRCEHYRQMICTLRSTCTRADAPLSAVMRAGQPRCRDLLRDSPPEMTTLLTFSGFHMRLVICYLPSCSQSSTSLRPGTTIASPQHAAPPALHGPWSFISALRGGKPVPSGIHRAIAPPPLGQSRALLTPDARCSPRLPTLPPPLFSNSPQLFDVWKLPSP